MSTDIFLSDEPKKKKRWRPRGARRIRRAAVIIGALAVLLSAGTEGWWAWEKRRITAVRDEYLRVTDSAQAALTKIAPVEIDMPEPAEWPKPLTFAELERQFGVALPKQWRYDGRPHSDPHLALRESNSARFDYELSLNASRAPAHLVENIDNLGVNVGRSWVSLRANWGIVPGIASPVFLSYECETMVVLQQQPWISAELRRASARIPGLCARLHVRAKDVERAPEIVKVELHADLDSIDAKQLELVIGRRISPEFHLGRNFDYATLIGRPGEDGLVRPDTIEFSMTRLSGDELANLVELPQILIDIGDRMSRGRIEVLDAPIDGPIVVSNFGITATLRPQELAGLLGGILLPQYANATVDYEVAFNFEVTPTGPLIERGNIFANVPIEGLSELLICAVPKTVRSVVRNVDVYLRAFRDTATDELVLDPPMIFVESTLFAAYDLAPAMRRGGLEATDQTEYSVNMTLFRRTDRKGLEPEEVTIGLEAQRRPWRIYANRSYTRTGGIRSSWINIVCTNEATDLRRSLHLAAAIGGGVCVLAFVLAVFLTRRARRRLPALATPVAPGFV